MNLNLTILGQAIAFALFVWFCMKYVWPPITSALRERQKRIADGLEAAAKSQQELERSQETYRQQTEAGRKRAREITDDAQKRRAEIIECAKQEAEEEKHRIQRQAEEQIDQQVREVRAQLQQDFGRLVAQGVAHIVQREVDITAHNQYIKDLAAKL